MSPSNRIESKGEPTHPRPLSSRPAPFAHLDNYGDEPPDGLELDDVEFIWRVVASRTSKKELRRKLSQVVQSHLSILGCLSYVPISDDTGRGRYPRAVALLLKQIFKPHMAIFATNDALYIQTQVWHAVTEASLQWVPVKSLPRHLRGRKLETELGL